MIAGPHDVFICDECVEICGEILEEEMGTDGEDSVENETERDE